MGADASNEPDPTFFSQRGIPEEIWRTRPYEWWEQGDLTATRSSHYASMDQYQRAFVSKILKQSSGWFITRHAPPMNPPADHIYPELRPINKVKTSGPAWHWHGAGVRPPDLKDWQRMPGQPGCKGWNEHIGRAKESGEHGDHFGTNTDALHLHQGWAKYVFPTAPKIPHMWDHDHATSWKRTALAKRPERLVGHVQSMHEGMDEVGSHWHVTKVADSAATEIARRIDVHPMAVPLIRESRVVYFVLEGCLKADAILAAGGAVFSVPSVSLWECRELERFVYEYLIGKRVVIVPDADWYKNSQVFAQARMCQIQLRRLGVGSLVAAPPPVHNGTDTKGVDDFVGAGGRLSDLAVVSHDPNRGLHDWIARQGGRWDAQLRNEKVLWALSTMAGSSGEYAAPLRTIAKVMSMSPSAVTRSAQDLERQGALTVVGDLSVKRGWFSGQLDWTERPRLILAPELRMAPRPVRRLAEIVNIKEQ